MAATTRGRIVKPKNPKDGLELAAKVFAKHLQDGNNSELRNLDGYDWSTVGPTISQAQAFHTSAESLKAQMEAQYRLRDAAYARIQEITDVSSTYLKGKYSKNPKKLTEWGFVVDDTKQSKASKVIAS